MATAVITIGRVSQYATLEDGSDCRTQTMTFAGTRAVSAIRAAGGDGVVTITPDADCWCVIKANPVDDDFAGDGTVHEARRLVADKQYQFAIRSGQEVALKT